MTASERALFGRSGFRRAAFDFFLQGPFLGGTSTHSCGCFEVFGLFSAGLLAAVTSGLTVGSLSRLRGSGWTSARAQEEFGYLLQDNFRRGSRLLNPLYQLIPKMVLKVLDVAIVSLEFPVLELLVFLEFECTFFLVNMARCYFRLCIRNKKIILNSCTNDA